MSFGLCPFEAWADGNASPVSGGGGSDVEASDGMGRVKPLKTNKNPAGTSLRGF